jgi:hypothetical protein
MVKLLVLAILVASASATGLLEPLLRTEQSCYAGCHSNYAAKAEHFEACRKGCDCKFYNEDCATQSKSFPTDELQASFQVGSTLNHPAVDPVKPIIAIDPVPETIVPEKVVPINPQPERPHSIILIRLRQRPSIQLPSMNRFFSSNDPMAMFNDMIKQFQDKANNFDETIRKAFEQKSKEFPKPPEFGTISELAKHIPIIRLQNNVRADSSSESSEENKDKRPLINEFKHVLQHPREHQQYLRERIQPIRNRIHQFFTDVRTEWNDLVRKQPKIPIWIFLCIILSSSAILWYMVMSLCRQTPSRNAFSVRAQELVFHPYDYEGYEKEKIQPDDQHYEVTEALPIKVKLSNI